MATENNDELNPKEEEIKETKEDLKRYALLNSLERSEAGQMVILGLKKDVVGAIDKLRSLYKTASQEELRAWCAVLDSRMTLLWAFIRGPKNHKFAAESLAELMKSVDAEND